MTSVVSCAITIAAPPEEVHPYFTDADLMLQWMGQRAELDAHPDGRFAVDINGSLVRGRYLVVTPERIVFTWGFAGSAELPPGSSTVEVTFARCPEGTEVTIRHTDLPASERPDHSRGWRHFGHELAAALG